MALGEMFITFAFVCCSFDYWIYLRFFGVILYYNIMFKFFGGWVNYLYWSYNILENTNQTTEYDMHHFLFIYAVRVNLTKITPSNPGTSLPLNQLEAINLYAWENHIEITTTCSHDAVSCIFAGKMNVMYWR